MQTDLRIHAQLTRESGEIQESLVVFLDVHDPDGVEDVGWIVVELPEYGVGWELEGESLAYIQRGEEHWFGTSGLTIPGMDRVPRGASVRFTVGDLGGRMVEREVRIPVSTMSPGAEDFPSVQRNEGFVVAPEGVRHFIRHSDQLYRLDLAGDGRWPSERLPVSPDGSVLETLGDTPFTVVTEAGPYLWLESGPWSSADF